MKSIQLLLIALVWLTAPQCHPIGMVKLNSDVYFGCANTLYRDTSNNKNQIEGSGIGLALVKEMVEANGGTINLVSELNRGSRFEVELPRSNQPVDNPLSSPAVKDLMKPAFEPAVITTSQEPTMPINLPFATQLDDKPSIVIIEDNHQMLDFLFEIFSNDYHCLPASTGQDGIGLVIEQVPEIIICDLMLPDIDGLQIAKIFKNDERTCHIPFVLLTAKGDIETRIDGWRQSIDEFICKPFIESELKARVANLLTIRQILAKRFGSQMLNQTTVLEQSELPEKDRAFLARFAQIVDDHLSQESFNRAKAASLLAVSERQMQRKLAALTDNNFTEFVRMRRLNKAKDLLAEEIMVAQVVDAVGFSSVSYFGSCFKAEFGITPKQYQMQCREQREPIGGL